MDIHVDVDPSRGDAYRGEVGVNLQLGRRRSSIELHAVDLRVQRARLRIAGEERSGRVLPHPERETIEIVFSKPLPPGHARLELSFSGRLRGDLCGLYRAESHGRSYAFSQLAPSNARRFFPCFDEPALKARFRMTVTTGAENQVLSNGPLEGEDLLAGGRKTLRFAATPLISSYGVALAVGPLESSAPMRRGDTEIRVWFVPGKSALSHFALETAAECLSRLESWFELPHPYPKLDLVAVPEFEFGAMENPGAVFFRENLLLLDPRSVSLEEKKRAAEVIAHEIAHMWFGNLVTMAWWDDLWLNEAFATWMAFAIVDAWQPHWRMWQSFAHRRADALDADSFVSTHPVYTPVRSAAEAAENFDLITYEKGASVVRMLERYLGEEVFREGVRLYVRRHREANAVAADLWSALAQESNLDVSAIVRPWIEQPGHPVVSVTRREWDGLGVIELQQRRFFERPLRRGAPVGSHRARWPVPWVGRVGTGLPGETRLVRHLLTRQRERIPGHGAELTFVYGNADEGGFFRPLHGEAELQDLIEDLPSLCAVERQALVDHQWALARSGDAPLAGLLDLAAALGADRCPDVLAAVERPLLSLCKRLAPDAVPASEARLRAWVEVYYGGQVDELGWEPLAGEDDDTRLRRARILSIVGHVGQASTVTEEAVRRCHAYLADRTSLDPNLAGVVVRMAAARGDEALFEAFVRAQREAHTPQEKRRFLFALGDFGAPDLVARSLALCLEDEVATQDVVSLLTRLLANRLGREATWSFIRRRWSALRKRIPPQHGSRLIAATPALLSREHRREVASFFREHPLPASERALRQALERFDWYADFRRRAAPQLESYLAG